MARAPRSKMAMFTMLMLLLPVFLPMAMPLVAGEDDTAVSRDHRDLDPLVNPYLYHAEAAARWLMSIAVEPTDGVYKWYISDLESNDYSIDLSIGASGIGTFFTELYKATENESYLEYAEGAAKYIISRAEPMGQDAARWSNRETYISYNVDKFAGAGAVGEFMLLLYQTTDDQTYLDYSKKAAHWLMDIAIPELGGYKWENYPGADFNFTGWAHGVAGIADFFRLLYIETDDDTYLEYAEGGARYLLAIARTPAAGQYAWVRIETDANTNPSWCGGTIGIIQFLLLLYDTTNNETYLDYAEGGASNIMAQAQVTGPGEVMVQGTSIFCHGEPSTSYVFHMLYETTGKGIYLKYGDDSANWTLNQGIEVGLHEMKWPSIAGTDYYEVGLLRGASGIGHNSLHAYNISEAERHLDFARKAANWVVNQSKEVSPGVEKWNWEEDLREEEYCTGWYHGVAGIGLYLIEMIPFWDAPVVFGVDIMEGDQEGSGLPNETVQYELTIENTGNVLDKLSLEFTEPADGWDATLDIVEADLGPEGNTSVKVDVTIPLDALAGESDTIQLTLSSLGDATRTDAINITTTVEGFNGVDIESDDITGRVAPGEKVVYEFDIVNTGNMVDDIIVKVKDPELAGWTVAHSFDGKAVPAGAKRGVRIELTSPEDALTEHIEEILVTAQSKNDLLAGDEIRITTNVDPVFGIEVLDQDLTGSVLPEETLAYEITVVNKANTDDTMIVYAIGSDEDDWKTDVTYDANFTAGEEKNVTVKVTPSAGLLAGASHTMALRFMSEGDDTQFEDLNITTTVLPVTNFEVLAPEGKTAKPDVEIEHVFTVVNDGNHPDTYEIRAVSEHGWEVAVSNGASTTVVDPGQQASVTVTIAVPATIAAHTTDVLTMWARSNTTGTEMVGNVTTTVSAIHSVGISLDQDHATVVRGNTTTFVLTIINLGNADEGLTIELLGGATSWSNMSGTALDLKMNGTETVSITVDPGMLVDGNELVDGTHGFEVVVKGDGMMETVEFKLTVTTPEPPPPPPTSDPDDRPLFGRLLVPLVLLVVIIACCFAAVHYLRRRAMGQQQHRHAEPGHQEYHEDRYPEEDSSLDHEDEEIIFRGSDIEEF